MSTTIHIPDRLIAQVDERARELGLSRNRLILRAIERLLEQDVAWSPSFLEELHQASGDREGRRALSQMRRAITRSRTRKAAPSL
jgi:predicted transcriptional regulator